MQSPVKQTASAYAAPNTPIASAKRPRIQSKMTLKPNPTRDENTDAPPNHTDLNHKESANPRGPKGPVIQRSDGNTVPPTPSKQLFSPGLRTEAGCQVHQEMGVSGSGGDGIEEEEEEEGVEEVPAEEAEELEADVEDTEEGAEGEEEGELEEFNPYQFISQLPPHSDVCILDKICLPPLSPGQSRTPLPTLALDLDETLVHCTVEPIPKPDLIFPVSFNGQVYQVYVRKRPYLDYFLETVSKSFEVVVFTASQKVYADTLLDKLDPTRKLVKHRLFREACLLVQGNYLKDLHVLGRDLRTTLLVDNSPHAYSYHNDNGVPIESWYDDDSDTELLKLIGFLKTLQGVDDVRPIVRAHFKTHLLVQRAGAGLPVSLSAPPF